MAEVLGVAASILQIAGAGTKLSLVLYNYTTSAARADQEIASIASDVELTSNALCSVADLFSSQTTHSVIAARAVRDASAIVKNCGTVFADIEGLIGKRRKVSKDGTKGGLSFVGKMTWPGKEPRLELYRRRLESLKSSLVLLLHVLQLAQGQMRGEMEGHKVEDEKSVIRELHWQHQASLKNLHDLEEKFDGMIVDDKEMQKANQQSVSIDLTATEDSDTADSDMTMSDTEDEHVSPEALAECAIHVQKLLKSIATMQHSLETAKTIAPRHKKRVTKAYRRFCRKFEYSIRSSPPYPFMPRPAVSLQADFHRSITSKPSQAARSALRSEWRLRAVESYICENCSANFESNHALVYHYKLNWCGQGMTLDSQAESEIEASAKVSMGKKKDLDFAEGIVRDLDFGASPGAEDNQRLENFDFDSFLHCGDKEVTLDFPELAWPVSTEPSLAAPVAQGNAKRKLGLGEKIVPTFQRMEPMLYELQCEKLVDVCREPPSNEIKQYPTSGNTSLNSAPPVPITPKGTSFSRGHNTTAPIVVREPSDSEASEGSAQNASLWFPDNDADALEGFDFDAFLKTDEERDAAGHATEFSPWSFPGDFLFTQATEENRLVMNCAPQAYSAELISLEQRDKERSLKARKDQQSVTENTPVFEDAGSSSMPLISSSSSRDISHKERTMRKPPIAGNKKVDAMTSRTALADYQQQLMLLGAQNKKRLLMAKQELGVEAQHSFMDQPKLLSDENVAGSTTANAREKFTAVEKETDEAMQSLKRELMDLSARDLNVSEHRREHERPRRCFFLEQQIGREGPLQGEAVTDATDNSVVVDQRRASKWERKVDAAIDASLQLASKKKNKRKARFSVNNGDMSMLKSAERNLEEGKDIVDVLLDQWTVMAG